MKPTTGIYYVLCDIVCSRLVVEFAHEDLDRVRRRVRGSYGYGPDTCPSAVLQIRGQAPETGTALKLRRYDADTLEVVETDRPISLPWTPKHLRKDTIMTVLTDVLEAGRLYSRDEIEELAGCVRKDVYMAAERRELDSHPDPNDGRKRLYALAGTVPADADDEPQADHDPTPEPPPEPKQAPKVEAPDVAAAGYQRRIDKLGAALKDARRQLADQRDELAGAEAEIEELQKHVDTVAGERDQARQELEEVRNYAQAEADRSAGIGMSREQLEDATGTGDLHVVVEDLKRAEGALKTLCERFDVPPDREDWHSVVLLALEEASDPTIRQRLEELQDDVEAAFELLEGTSYLEGDVEGQPNETVRDVVADMLQSHHAALEAWERSEQEAKEQAQN